jgi:predicted dehydrogenase
MRVRSLPGQQKIGYAIVGLGYISQIAVLPAFKNAQPNSKLVALVSDDPVKLKQLGRKYRVSSQYSYDQYDECLNNPDVQAVYIALPNSMHSEYTIRAAEAGKHILCEKPMSVTEDECQAMIDACSNNNVKLMIAYRLHFERANLEAMELARASKIGDLRIFSSLFTMQVKKGNSRLKKELGGGTLYDIGIYCINAARNLFQEEPEKVFAFYATNPEDRFHEVEEMITAIMYFPQNRLASFTCSFGAADVSTYRVVGTKGSIQVDNAYEHSSDIKLHIQIDGSTQHKVYRKRDQFGPELVYFSDCILKKKDPEPSGKEGLADVRIIRALYRSAQMKEAVVLNAFDRRRRPTLNQEIQRPPFEEPDLVHAESPSGR